MLDLQPTKGLGPNQFTQLGRDMGRITLTKPGTFMIRPAGNAMQTLALIASKPYASLDIALL